MSSRLSRLAVIALLLIVASPADPRGGRGRRAWRRRPEPVMTQILGRPTDRGATLSVHSPKALDAFVEYGAEAGKLTAKTKVTHIDAGGAAELELVGLAPGTRVHYRLRTRSAGETAFARGPTYAFHTQRRRAESFTFALQGDSHPERVGKMFDAELYRRTLVNVAADRPDFYVLMGDDFSIDPLIAHDALTQASVDDVYLHQRTFLTTVGAATPLFLVNGNHEQAALALLDGTPGSPAVMAGRARNRLFPLPAPDAFYSGNSEAVQHVGLPRDYYAWTWGDALFVVIDPYWHSATAVDGGGGGKSGRKGRRGRKRDLWTITLGDAQYRWLRETLAKTDATYKFVFTHHVLGTGRGGIELTDLCEWGGRDRRGRWEFAEKRPGWELPIHQLMVKHRVTILFQGHDHLYARQERDGIVYQSVPNPADPTYTAFNREAYRSGDVFPNSGHLRVTVTSGKVTVDYVHSAMPEDEKARGKNGKVVFSYDVVPARKNLK